MSDYLRAEVRAMKAYTPGEQVNECIKLNTNECAWGPSPKVLEALAGATGNSLRLYPSPLGDKLRQAAAEVYGVDAAQVLVGNGSDDCLTVIMRSFLQPGDKVACPWPTYSLYDTLASIQGVEIQHHDWLAAADPAVAAGGGGVAGWHLPVSALAASGARVVFVASPNNPSATLVPLHALETLAGMLPGVLVVDEAYIDYACDGDGMAASFIKRLAAFPNVLVLRTFSKSYAMAGARLGLMFADAELIGHMNKVKDSYNVNALTQLAGEAALRDRAHFEWLVKETLAQREVLAAAFQLPHLLLSCYQNRFQGLNLSRASSRCEAAGGVEEGKKGPKREKERRKKDKALEREREREREREDMAARKTDKETVAIRHFLTVTDARPF